MPKVLPLLDFRGALVFMEYVLSVFLGIIGATIGIAFTSYFMAKYSAKKAREDGYKAGFEKGLIFGKMNAENEMKNTAK